MSDNYYVEGYIDDNYYRLPDTTGYYLEGYLADDYFEPGVTIVEAEATLAVAASAQPLATVGVIKQFNSDLDGVFTPSITLVASRNGSIDAALQTALAANNSRLRTVDVTLDNIVNLSLQSARIRPAVSGLTVSSDVINTASRTRSNSSSLAVSFGQTVAANIVKQTTAAVNASATITAQIDKIIAGDSAITTAFSQTAQINKTIAGDSAITTAFSQTAINNVLRGFETAQTSEFTSNANARKFAGTEANINLQSAISNSPTRIKQLAATLSGVFAPTAQVFATRAGDIDLIVGTSQTALADITRTTSASVAASTAQSTTNDRIRTTSAAIAVETAIGTVDGSIGIGGNSGETDVGIIKSTDANLNLNTNQTADVNITTDAAANYNATTAIAATVAGIRPLASLLTVTTQITDGADGIGASGGVIPLFEQSSIQVDSTLDATANTIAGGAADLVGAFTIASDGDTLIQAQLTSAFGVSATGQQTFGRPNTWVEQSTLTFSTDAQFGTHSLASSIKRNFTSTTMSSFNFGTDAFAIEAWVKPNNLTFDTSVYSANVNIQGADGTTYLSSVEVTSDLRFKFRNIATGGLGTFNTDYQFTVETAANTLNNNAWNHIAIAKDGEDNYRLYVNGTLEASYTHDVTVNYQSQADSINITAHSGLLVDEHRISRFTPRYTGSTYTVPTSQFVNDVYTTNLLHLDNNLLDDYGANTALLYTTANLTALGGLLIEVDSNLSSDATVDASASKTVEANANLVGFATTLTEGVVIPAVQLDATTLATSATLTAEALKYSLQDATTTQASEFSLDATVKLKSALNGVLAAESTLTANGKLTKTASADLAVEITAQTKTQQVQITGSDIGVVSTLAASSTVTYVSPTAELAVETGIELLFIDTARYVYVVPKESRVSNIYKETRTHTIHKETRKFTLGEL